MTEASEVPFGAEVTKGFIAKFLLAAIGFAGTIFFARILGPVSFGGFYLLLSVIHIVKLPVDGFSEASKKRFSESQTDRQAIAGATWLVVVAVGILGSIAAFHSGSYLAAFTGLEDALILFVVLFVALSLFTPFQGLLSGTGRISRTIWIDFLRSLLTTPLQLVFVLYGYGAAGMAYGLSVATLFTIPVTHYFLRTVPRIPNRDTLDQLWSYARHSSISALLSRAYSRFDILLLGLLLTPAAAAQYEVALKLTLPAILVSEVAGEGLMARVSNLDSKGRAVALDISNTLSFASILSIPIFFGALILSRSLVVTVYGPEYAKAANLLIGLALFRLFETQVSPLGQAIKGLDRPDINVRVSAVALVVNIVLGILFTIRIGSIGVVIATVIAEGFRYVSLATILRRQLPELDLLPRTLLEQLFAAVLMAVFVYGVVQFIQIRSWINLGALLLTGTVVYAVTLFACSPTHRMTVVSIIEDAAVR